MITPSTLLHLLGDHNARVVMAGAAALGIGCGVVGTYLTLRRRALLGDALSHAALPGVAVAFLVGVAVTGAKSAAAGPASSITGAKSLPLLLVGGALGGLAGVIAMNLLRRFSPLRDDAILATVLSVFFGAGIVLLSAIQSLTTGHAAGLEGFIYGRTAAMVEADAWLIAAVAATTVGAAVVLAKEWQALCFDESFTRASGLRVGVLDGLLMALATLVTVVGMQAVGLILVVALQVIPAAAARCWSDRLPRVVLLAALLGALAGVVGAGASALAPDLPSGPMIVLAAAAIFAASLLLGSSRGVLWHGLAQWRGARRVAVEHLLRALYEEAEARGTEGATRGAIAARRRFLPGALAGALRRARRSGWLREASDRSLHLTDAGRVEAERLTARHRLWEHFLIEQAGVSPSHVDRDADLVEHVLSPALLARIAQAVSVASAGHPAASGPAAPPSPHALGGER